MSDDTNPLFPETKYDPFKHHVAPCEIPNFFREGLKRIGGVVGATNRPRLRVKWGGEIRWLRNGMRVPRYVVARDMVRIETKRSSGLVSVALHPRFYAYPHFFIEEWRAVDKFVQSGSGDEAKRDWESHRFETGLANTPTDVQRSKDVAIFTMADGTKVSAPPDASWWDVCPAGDPFKREDTLGEFPEGGRYDFLLRINPAFQAPNQHWLDQVEKIFHERNHPKYMTPEAEAAALFQADHDMREAGRAKRDAELVDAMMTSKNVLTNPRPHQGGSGGRVFIGKASLTKKA